MAANPSDFTRRQRTQALVGVMLALTLAALDQTIVATAGPAIQRDLHIRPALYHWITTAYLVAATVMLPIYGKLSDVFGRKPILLTGIGIFLAGSLLCGVAPSTLMLVLARAVQGLGAAALFTSTFAVIADLYPPAERGRYTGLIGGVMGVSSVIGPLIGGFLTDTLGWHWVFFVNLPVGALAVWFIVTKMPRLGTRHADPTIDFAGAVALIVAVVPMLIALSLGRGAGAQTGDGWPWASWQVLGMFGVSLAGWIAFVAIERRAADPILHFEIFRVRAIALPILASFILGASFLFGIVFLPLYMVNVVGVSATSAGLSLVPLTLGMVAGSIASGQVVARLGRYKALLVGSLGLLIAGFVLMGFTLTPHSTQGGLVLRMILVGLGVGPSLPLYMLVAQNEAKPRELGVVTAAITFSRSLGQGIGVAICGTLFAATLMSNVAREGATAVVGLTPGARALVAGATPLAAAAAEGAAVARFDAVAAAAAIRQAPRARPEDRDAAIAAVGRMDEAMRVAFTRAISVLYRFGIGIVVLALVVTLMIPEHPLRRHHQEPAAAEVP